MENTLTQFIILLSGFAFVATFLNALMHGFAVQKIKKIDDEEV